jgi:hypothetical protein
VQINSSSEERIVARFSRLMASRLLGFGFAVSLFFGSYATHAQVLVFDRGLPTANLNSAAGANKSNVEWADIETLPETPWLPGDDFSLAGTGPYTITTIRVWSTDSAGLTLRGGVAGGAIGVISTVYTATPVSYANLQGYETLASGFLQLYEINFTVNIPLNGGVTYRYFLDGPATASGQDFMGVHLHASNAPLSGSTQSGADGTFLFLGNDGTVYTWNSLTGGGTYCPGCVGWDKVSDANVQVFALAPQPQVPVSVPVVSRFSLAGLALLLGGTGFLLARRRRRI